MSLNQKRTSEVLSSLDWQGGLTRDDIFRLVNETDGMDTSDAIRLHRSLPEDRQFYSFEEAVNAVDPASWEK